MRSLSVYHLYASSVVSVMQSNLERETVVPGVESTKDSERRSDLVVLKHMVTSHSHLAPTTISLMLQCNQISIYSTVYPSTLLYHRSQTFSSALSPLFTATLSSGSSRAGATHSLINLSTCCGARPMNERGSSRASSSSLIGSKYASFRTRSIRSFSSPSSFTWYAASCDST